MYVFDNENAEEKVIPNTPAIKTEREKILDQAKKCVCGDRDQQYGSPENNFANVAKFWSDYFNIPISAEDVSVAMCLFKIARIMAGGTPDSYVDLAGYAACAGEINAHRPIEEGKGEF